MPDELDRLADQEDRLLAKVSQVESTSAEKEQKLREEGVFNACRQIYAEYARLAVQRGSLQALKRAFFLMSEYLLSMLESHRRQNDKAA